MCVCVCIATSLPLVWILCIVCLRLRKQLLFFQIWKIALSKGIFLFSTSTTFKHMHASPRFNTRSTFSIYMFKWIDIKGNNAFYHILNPYIILFFPNYLSAIWSDSFWSLFSWPIIVVLNIVLLAGTHIMIPALPHFLAIYLNLKMSLVSHSCSRLR